MAMAMAIAQGLVRSGSHVWPRHLVPEDSVHVHDVVSALKLFLRSQSECVMTDTLLPSILRNNAIEDRERRLHGLKSLFAQLPLVHYCTLKRLAAQLVSVVDHADKNEMFASNLAPAVAPLLFFSSSESVKEQLTAASNRAQDVLEDILANYVFLFDVTPDQEAKERQILKTLLMLRETRVLAKPAIDKLAQQQAR